VLRGVDSTCGIRRASLTLAVTLITTAAYAGAEACRPLKDADHGWAVRVSAPGNYCMGADLKQAETLALLRLPHQPAPGSPLLTIASADVSIDLERHELLGNRASALGLWLNGGGAMRYFPARVRNGTIRTEKRPAVFMVYAWNRDETRFSDRAVADSLALAGNAQEYVATRFVLEDLTLEADEVAVILQGRGNVIRRCKIIGGNSAVNLYGPDLVFEDNEIVMNASVAKPGGEAPIALYLQDAGNSVLRNNRITIKGRDAGAEAIVLKNSPNVVLQNNRVNGGVQSYKLMDQQSSIEEIR
jgi:hypothetical protein